MSRDLLFLVLGFYAGGGFLAGCFFSRMAPKLVAKHGIHPALVLLLWIRFALVWPVSYLGMLWEERN
jgi:hypothetical protein